MQYSDIFVGPDGSPGFTDLITHKIDTGDAKPPGDNDADDRNQTEEKGQDHVLEVKQSKIAHGNLRSGIQKS